SDRSGGDRCVGAEGQLPVGNAVDTLAGGEHQYQVRGLYAQLPPETAPAHADEHRIAEIAVLVPHDEHTPPVPAARDESDFRHVRYDGDAVGPIEKPVGNELVARRADLLEHLGGREQLSLLARLPVRLASAERQRDTCKQSQKCDATAHAAIP